MCQTQKSGGGAFVMMAAVGQGQGCQGGGKLNPKALKGFLKGLLAGGMLGKLLGGGQNRGCCACQQRPQFGGNSSIAEGLGLNRGGGGGGFAGGAFAFAMGAKGFLG